MLFVACLVVTALLLWLAAGIGVLAERRSAKLAWRVRGVAIALSACALWWPAHALHTEGTLAATSGARSMLAWLPALALSALGLATTRAWALGSWAGSVVASTVKAE